MPRQTNAQVAQEWRAAAVSRYTWAPCKDQTGVKEGEAGGYRVEAEGFDRVCYLKPAKKHGDEEKKHCRAAREKIASDLAFDLGLPQVPPAQLTTREDAPEGCTKHVVVSLIQYQKQWPWSDIKGTAIQENPIGAALAQAMARCSALLPFDTWTAQSDHNDHPDNIVWGYDPGKLAASAIVFLDYSNSMGFNGSWAGDGWRAVTKPSWMPLMLQHIDRKAVRASVEAIEHASPDTIRDIVRRIPKSYLPVEHADAILNGLLERRSLVRAALTAEIAAEDE